MSKINKIFVAGIDAHAGISFVTMGLLDMLSQRLDNPGFFKPVGKGKGEGDKDVLLMKSVCNLEVNSGNLCPLDIEEAHGMMARGEEGNLLEKICAAYDTVRAENNFVVIQGTNYQHALDTFDININASIAGRLGAPVLLVATASMFNRPVSPHELTSSVLSAQHSFEEKNCDLLGVIINRVVNTPFEEHRDYYLDSLEKEGINVLGIIPNIDFLGMPRVSHIIDVLDAELISGRIFKNNIVTKTFLAAMEPRNFFKCLKYDHIMVITPGDREDILLSVAMSQMSKKNRRISGLILTDGFRPHQSILDIVCEKTGSSFPILLTDTELNSAIKIIGDLEINVTHNDKEKIFAASATFDRCTDQNKILNLLKYSKSSKLKAGSFLESLVAKAGKYNKAIVFPEGEESRIIQASSRLAQGKILRPVLLGNPDRVRETARAEGVSLKGIEVVDPLTSPERERYAGIVYEIRKHKRGGMTPETALKWLSETPNNFGTAMLQAGDVDGLVSGSVHSTADTIRPAFQVIGVNPGIGMASSVFIMVFKDRVLIYGDCAIIPNPNVQELAGIAIAGAHTAKIFGITPRVAMLSYSTGTSGSGGDVNKVAEAKQIVCEREPFLAVDGPIQYDAAIDMDVAKAKQPGSPVAGRATVFIFPDLDAGNIVYKAVQRMSGAMAVGPIMQGLKKPVNDLSRGCSVEDIYYVGAITAIQATELTHDAYDVNPETAKKEAVNISS